MKIGKLVALGCAGALSAASVQAFSPGPPRPVPANVTGVCSDDQGANDDPYGPCDGDSFICNSGAVCLVDTSVESVLGEARAVLTLIVDEDVAGFLANTDPSVPSDPDNPTDGRPANARFTALLEFQASGKPVALSETFQLDRICDSIQPEESNLCVPSWSEPLTEARLIAAVAEVQDLQLQWAFVNANLRNAIRSALLTPAELAANPNATVLLELVDGVHEGFLSISADEVARFDQFDHAADGLASVRRLKVTLKVVVP